MSVSDWFNLENIATLFGGLIIIIYTLWQILFKLFSNFGWIKEKREAKEKKKREERQKEIIDIINENVMPSIFQEIAEINNEQNSKLDKLLNSSNDTLRGELLKLYFRYRKYKKIPQWAKENAEKLHNDYVAQEGNSFVEDLWRQMSTWEMVPSEENLFINRSREKI